MKLAPVKLILVTSLLLAACGPGSAPDASETAEEGMPGMGGMEGMGGMDGMDEMQGRRSGTMSRMAAHLQTMEGMRGDNLQGMLSTHRQMVGNMIGSMNREMRAMDMPADEAWDATVDSLRNDLVTMADMDAAELEALMPAHRRRMTRLMEMHREMMAGMGM